MINFLEPYIQKKLSIAKNMYLYGNQIPEEKVLKIGLSKSTMLKYQNEVRGMYKEEQPMNGSLYSVDSFRRIVQRYSKDSNISQILRLIFLDPGHKADYYKNKLTISDATFSRNISAIKKNLAEFGTLLVSKSGYFLESGDEWQNVLLFTHLVIFYQWDESEIDKRIEAFCGKQILETIEAYDFKCLTFEGTVYEQHFFSLLTKVAILRDYQFARSASHPQEKFVAVIEYLADKNETTNQLVEKKWAQLKEDQYIARISKHQLERLKKLLCCATFQIELFPYEIKYMPLRHYLFEQKYTLAFPEKVIEIDYFIQKMSDKFGINLSYRHAVIFHFIVIEELLKCSEIEERSIFVFSDLGDTHAKYLHEKIGFILDTMKKNFKVELYQENKKLTLGSQDILVTNRLAPLVAKKNQIIVDDYLSTNDQIFLEKVLNKVLN